MLENGENSTTFTIHESSMGQVITMRRATTADARDVFEWRNDPQTRWASISQEPIDWESHLSWFARSVGADDRRLFIAEDLEAEQPAGAVGIVRFDMIDGERAAEVSINLNPGWRGRGVGSATLLAGLAALRAERGRVPELLATIRPENVASLQLFTRAGFVEASADDDFAYYRRDAEDV